MLRRARLAFCSVCQLQHLPTKRKSDRCVGGSQGTQGPPVAPQYRANSRAYGFQPIAFGGGTAAVHRNESKFQGSAMRCSMTRSGAQWIAIGFLIVLCSFSAAGQAPLGGPTLGFITDENGATIWPLLGVLGAAVPGQPLELSHAIVNATFSPQQNYALAIAAANTQPVLIRLDVSNPQIYSLPGARFNPGLIAISPAGGSAALYDRGSGVLQLLSGLPDSPQIAYEFDMSSLGGEVRAVAVSDDASLALVNIGNEGRAVWLIDAKGPSLPVNAVQPSQMTFIANRHDALIADDATQEVFLLQSMDQNPARLSGLVLRGNIRQFAAIAASADGRLIFASQNGSADIFILDLQTKRTSIVPCHCKPTVFSALKGASVFRLNGLPNGPITVLDASSVNPRTLIIPIDMAALTRTRKAAQ